VIRNKCHKVPHGFPLFGQVLPAGSPPQTRRARSVHPDDGADLLRNLPNHRVDASVQHSQNVQPRPESGWTSPCGLSRAKLTCP
jgi:hypothetical protein